MLIKSNISNNFRSFSNGILKFNSAPSRMIFDTLKSILFLHGSRIIVYTDNVSWMGWILKFLIHQIKDINVVNGGSWAFYKLTP